MNTRAFLESSWKYLIYENVEYTSKREMHMMWCAFRSCLTRGSFSFLLISAQHVFPCTLYQINCNSNYTISQSFWLTLHFRWQRIVMQRSVWKIHRFQKHKTVHLYLASIIIFTFMWNVNICSSKFENLILSSS